MATLPKNYRRDCLLGALERAAHAHGRSLPERHPGLVRATAGCFLREAYLSGAYPGLAAAAPAGNGADRHGPGRISPSASAIRQVQPQYRKTRGGRLGTGGAVYLASAAALHLLDRHPGRLDKHALRPCWAARKRPRLIQSQYARLIPGDVWSPMRA